MININHALWVATRGLLSFVILCFISASFEFLHLYLVGLIGCIIWMVLIILKNGHPSAHTFDGRFYEDEDLGPYQE